MRAEVRTQCFANARPMTQQRIGQRIQVCATLFHIGEGMLEIGVVLSSLYFIAKRKIFPLTGAIIGALGCLAAATGLLG